MNFPVSTTSKFSTQYLMDYETFHSSWWEKSLILSLCKLQGLFNTFGWSFLVLWLHILVSTQLNSSSGGYPLQFSRVFSRFPFVLSNTKSDISSHISLPDSTCVCCQFRETTRPCLGLLSCTVASKRLSVSWGSY